MVEMKEKSRKKRNRSNSGHRRNRSRSKEKKSRSKSKTRNDRIDRSRELKRNRSDSKERGSEKRKKSRSKSIKKRRRSSSSSSSDEEKRRHNRRSASRDKRRKITNKKSKKDKLNKSQEYSNSDDDVEIIKEPDRKPELERGLLFKDLIKHPVKEKSQEPAPEQQHYPVPAPSSDSGFGAFTSTISAPEPEPAPKSIPKPVPKPTPVPTLSLFCNLCQFKSEDRMAREEHMTEPQHQKNMLRMGEVISEFIKKHKNLNKLINIKSTYWKPEKENKPKVGKMPVEKAKEPEPDVIVVMEAEPEIEVLDPRKAPFLYTSHLMVCFDVKLTDASVASEIYQVSKSWKTMIHNPHLYPTSPSPDWRPDSHKSVLHISPTSGQN